MKLKKELESKRAKLGVSSTDYMEVQMKSNNKHPRKFTPIEKAIEENDESQSYNLEESASLKPPISGK